MKTEYCYLMTDGVYYKIGKSINPNQRLKQLKTANPNINLIDYTDKIKEKDLHKLYINSKVDLEWYNLKQNQVNDILYMFENGKTYNFESRLKQVKTIKKTIDLYNETILNFGKYRGVKLSDVKDYSYLKWLKNQMYNDLSNSERKKDKLYKAISYALKCF
jgi:hypothetical protein